MSQNLSRNFKHRGNLCSNTAVLLLNIFAFAKLVTYMLFSITAYGMLRKFWKAITVAILF